MFDDLFNFTENTDDSSDGGFISFQGDVFGSSSSVESTSFYSSNDVNVAEVMDDMIMPSTKPRRVESERPLIVLIDDDFSTIDLMKIYLQRDYDYKAFDNPKEAIFYLNKCVPDLIFLDCYISIIKSKKVLEIIKSYPEYENVPVFFLVEPDELGAINAKIVNEGINGIEGVLTRPVRRGDLQAVLDKVFPKE